MTSDPEFLTLEEVLTIHGVQLDRWGGAEGIRDLGALESAIAQPQATFEGEYLYDDVFSMAAAYAFHIAEAQAFIDGNKRTALDAALTFLVLNNVRRLDPDLALFEAMIEISQRAMSKNQLARLLRELAGI